MTMIEPWFIPSDIFMIIFLLLGMILCLIFLCIIIIDKACHTVSFISIGNTCLAAFLFGFNMFFMVIFTLKNDIKQIEYQDRFCILRAYIGYVTVAAYNHSFFLQSIYRYLIVVYPTRLFWQSATCQILFLISIWIFCFIYSFVFLFKNEVIYNVDNQICQLPLRGSFNIIYLTSNAYVIPISLVIVTYIKLIRYVHQMSKRVVSANVLSRARKELQMVRRIVILVMILVFVCLPYEIFAIMSLFTNPPQYHFRIAYIFVDLSYALVLICLFQFTEPLKTYVMKKLKPPRNIIVEERIV